MTQALTIHTRNPRHVLISVEKPSTLRLDISLTDDGNVSIEAYDYRGTDQHPVHLRSLQGEGGIHPQVLFMPAPVDAGDK